MPPSRRRRANTSKILARRTKPKSNTTIEMVSTAQTNASSAQQADGNDSGIDTTMADTAASADASAVPGNNITANADDDDADEEEFEINPDDRLDIATAAWPLKLIDPPKPGDKAEDRLAYEACTIYTSPFIPHTARNGAPSPLSGRYAITKRWTSMKTYRSIMVSSVRYRRNEFVVIRPSREHNKLSLKVPGSDEREVILNPKNGWIAYVHEFRALNDQNVYALVAWLYWPDDLITAWGATEKAAKNGRKGYHGTHELLASNHLDIIDVHTIDRPFTEFISQNMEVEGEVSTEYYWRQTYDYRTGKLSELKRDCRCNKYSRADATLLRCPSATCGLWLHQECIVDAVLSKKWSEICRAERRRVGGRPSGAPENDSNSVHVDNRRYRRRLEGHVVAGDNNTVEVKDLQLDTTTLVHINCIKCGALFK